VWGSSSGLAIPISKAFGAHDMPGVRRAVAGGAYVALGVGAFITFVGLVFGQPLLRLIGTPEEVFAGTWAYLAITFGGAITAVAFNYLSAAIRAVGDSKTPLYFLIAASILNAILVVLFVGVWHLGLAGAAATTVVSQGAASLACAWLVWKRFPTLLPSRREWLTAKQASLDAARLGLPMGFQVSVMAIGAVVLQRALNGLGTDAVAAFTAGIRVEQLATTGLFSFGIAIITYVAQNRGAEQWSRIRKGVMQMTWAAAAIALASGVLIVIFANQLVSLFVIDDAPQVHALAVQFLRINGFTYWILAVKFILRGGIQGLGNTLIATICSIMELVSRAVAGLFLVSTFGFVAAVLATPVAWATAVIVLIPAWIHFRRGLLRNERESEALQTALTIERSPRSHDDARDPHQAPGQAQRQQEPALQI
ncbi:MAG: MATE family efflux transporter, partial [Promicromonosporaceae bacterium]|nr:MATE family efflux transporter [Promicromonosporaceae bacterium]